MVMGQCLKCGKDTSETAAFCEACVTDMEQYPVKPGAVAHLIPRPKRPEYKPPETYREAANRAQLQQAKRTVRWLMILTVILSALLLTSAWMLLQSLEETPTAPPIGKNYTTTQTNP